MGPARSLHQPDTSSRLAVCRALTVDPTEIEQCTPPAPRRVKRWPQALACLGLEPHPPALRGRLVLWPPGVPEQVPMWATRPCSSPSSGCGPVCV